MSCLPCRLVLARIGRGAALSARIPHLSQFSLTVTVVTPRASSLLLAAQAASQDEGRTSPMTASWGEIPIVDDPRRSLQPGVQRISKDADGIEDEWPDPVDRTVLGMDKPDRVTAAEIPFFADSYAEDWERLERYAVRQRFRTGDDIVRQGQRPGFHRCGCWLV